MKLDDVAEIIGWELVDNRWYRPETAYREERQRIKANGEYWNTSKLPEVDDLLAWLNEGPGEWQRGVDCIEPHTDGWRVSIYNPTYQDTADHVAPTLLEALRDAVRSFSEAPTSDRGAS